MSIELDKEAFQTIMDTSPVSEGDLLKSYGMGVEHYITKPFSSNQLVRACETIHIK